MKIKHIDVWGIIILWAYMNDERIVLVCGIYIRVWGMSFYFGGCRFISGYIVGYGVTISSPPSRVSAPQ